ncbi:MAG: type IX secretion system sortase PorU [Bacteroidales bacterium]|nr:type IX secretion system sortase PorU [Bacteroidales bacterium]
MRSYLLYIKTVTIFIITILTIDFSFANTHKYAPHSVLSNGKWIKIAVNKDGIYKLSYEDLTGMGLISSPVSSSKIKLYGNGNGMLDENISNTRPDDLVENSIQIVDGGDQIFSSGDYLLFYGQGPTVWTYNSTNKSFEHATNIYTNQSCYFLTINNEIGKRIELLEQTNGTPNSTVKTFQDYAVHEMEKENLIGSGREWYGELFDFETEYSFNFNFPNIVNTSHEIKTRIAARAASSSTFTVQVHNNTYSQSIPSVEIGNQNSSYAKVTELTKTFSCNQDNVNVIIKNNDISGGTIGWIDYIQLNVTRDLTLTDQALIFHSPDPELQSGLINIEVRNTSSNTVIWDITDKYNIKKVQSTTSNSTTSFLIENDQLQTFIAFNATQTKIPTLKGSVENQDLHKISDIDYIIIAPEEFTSQAQNLANFHRDNSGLSTFVVHPQTIYNEFSSGVQDVTAIRDFLKMVYDKSEKQSPRNVLMYGDGSYDYKNREENNTNLVPCWQSINSLHPINSYTTDDFFALLDDNKNLLSKDGIDIGIGRFPVSTVEQAQQALDKILHYKSHTPEVMKDWRNMLCFVADDEEGNSHMNQAEQLANYISQNYPIYNMDKIYLDAFIQESTPSGQRYPDVTTAINNRIKKGALIVNYTGHGGETGWTHEKVLNVQDINSWKNFDMLPVFITATCEFSRFDDPKRTSAGEYVFLNPEGGGIALFTTTRATYGPPNFILNLNIYKHAFEKIGNKYPTLGDLIRLAKEDASSVPNARKFILLGDPALRMNYPKYSIRTEEVIDQNTQQLLDTVRALDQIKIKGTINDEWGYILTDFNGECQIKMYDKKQMSKTLSNGNDPEFYFESQSNIIYSGKALVRNGRFETQFIIPKDIQYRYGAGKICYYAQNGQTDAAGFDNSIIVGGNSNHPIEDYFGPEITSFMNNQEFVNGGVTDENPVLYLYLNDDSGINTMGTGIGHDIVLILDSDYEHPVILNDFYEANWEKYGSGKLLFPFFNLKEGLHNLQLKVWDVHNNSSIASLDFNVVSSNQVYLEKVFNYPNPFSEQTTFSFEHNQPEKDLDIKIKIYNIHGVMVNEFETQLSTLGYLSRSIHWDGTDFNQNKLENGIYLYQVIVSTKDGISQIITKKSVLIK